MKTNKYNDFDTLTLYVKKSKSKDIISNYQKFGWVLVSQTENSRYEDIEDIMLERPHFVENKDELQLLQVYMEEKLNAIGKLERNKYPKTTSFGLIFGVFGLALLILSALFAFHVLNGSNLALNIVMASVGILFLISTAIVIPKLKNKEQKHFKVTHLNLTSEINQITKKATSLSGGAK